MLKLIALLVFSLHAQPRVDVLASETLGVLDQPGHYSFATVMNESEAEAAALPAGASAQGLKYLRLDQLAKSARYRSIADLVNDDILGIIAASGMKMAYSAEVAEKMAPDGNIPRHFDPFWLTSKQAAFPLIAVVNRVDKRDFYAGTCGEVRFIYRLAYYRADQKEGQTVESHSTLPMFLNVVYEYPAEADGGCAQTAARWNAPDVVQPADVPTLARALEAGPLAKANIRFKQIELNMQIVRYPSELKADFGGQAIYLFRIFREAASAPGTLAPIPLENTIDVGAVLKDPARRAKLLASLRASVARIDDGTFVLEDPDGDLLAKRAISFTTSGRGRLANKPYSLVFGANGEGLRDVPLSGAKFVRSARGLVERLNNSTCVGCHQTGGTAGFHMLGRGGVLSSSFNQVILPFSPHYGAERVRRAGYLQALIEARDAGVFAFRAPSFYPAAIDSDEAGRPRFPPAQTREACLADDQRDFAVGPRCAPDSICKFTVTNAAGGLPIGECLSVPNVVPGSVCRAGVITSVAPKPALGDLATLFAINDTIDTGRTFNDDGGSCTLPKQGVPLGRIASKCASDTADGRLEFADRLEDAGDAPAAMCALQGGTQFDECAKSPNPPECLASAVIVRAYLDTCSARHFCREDYICQQLPKEIARLYQGRDKTDLVRRIGRLTALGVGFCVPNYFVFNMREDGHILPEGRAR